MTKLTPSKALGWVPINFFMNVFYCFGASLMDSFVIYPGWLLLPPKEFLIVHTAQSAWIINTLVIPLAITTLLNLLLLSVKPGIIPRKLVLFSLACMATNWLLSFILQIPAHQTLLNHYDPEVLAELVVTNYIRVAVQVIQIVIAYQMLSISSKHADNLQDKRLHKSR